MLFWRSSQLWDCFRYLHGYPYLTRTKAYQGHSFWKSHLDLRQQPNHLHSSTLSRQQSAYCNFCRAAPRTQLSIISQPTSPTSPSPTRRQSPESFRSRLSRTDLRGAVLDAAHECRMNATPKPLSKCFLQEHASGAVYPRSSSCKTYALPTESSADIDTDPPCTYH